VFSTIHICSEYEIVTQKVDFYESMKADYKNHDLTFCKSDANWSLAENLYNTYYLDNPVYTQEPRIPYIIHHVWLGSLLPEYAKGFRQTWIDKHPTWTFVLWTDHPESIYGHVLLDSFDALVAYLQQADREQFIMMDVRHLRLRNQVAFDIRAKNYGEKSDVLRYEILHNIGGLYIDTDFECIRSFKYFNHCCDFYTGIAHTRDFILYNGLIGAAPHKSILEEIVTSLVDRPSMENSLSYSGPYFFTDNFLKKVLTFEGRAVAFPVTFFYGWPPYERYMDVSLASKYIAKESYALHYWKVSWLAKRSLSDECMVVKIDKLYDESAVR
jgi:hypothetical protein